MQWSTIFWGAIIPPPLMSNRVKSLAVQRLKKSEEQCIHHFSFIKYLVPMTMSILWITSFGKLTERPKGKKL